MSLKNNLKLIINKELPHLQFKNEDIFINRKKDKAPKWSIVAVNTKDSSYVRVLSYNSIKETIRLYKQGVDLIITKSINYIEVI